MNLDSVSDVEPAPSENDVAIVRDRFVGSGAEGGREGCRQPLFQGVTSDFPELRANRVQALSFALPDLDREQLEQVAITIRRSRAGAFGAIEQSVRDVESNRTAPSAQRALKR